MRGGNTVVITLVSIAAVAILAAVFVAALASPPRKAPKFQNVGCASCTLKPTSSRLSKLVPTADEIASASQRGIAAAREQFRISRM